MAYCRGCNKYIVWGETKEGKRIPLDPKPITYDYDEETGICERARHTYVSHFITCPDANKFSGSVKLRVNGKEVELNGFVQDLIAETVTGIVRSLRGVEDIDTIRLDISKKSTEISKKRI